MSRIKKHGKHKEAQEISESENGLIHLEDITTVTESDII